MGHRGGAAAQHRAHSLVAGALMQANPVTTLILHFMLLSILAVGGANSVIPEMHRLVVENNAWMTDRQFADLFAIAQIAPGPNIIIVTLIGYQVAGIVGALATTAAMCLPSCLLVYATDFGWQHFREAKWRIVLQAAIVPVSVGLIAASALIVAQTADASWTAVAITLATAGVAYFTRLHPLWMFALAAVLGYVGLT
ncbi:chromate transporter [Variibacter gotjawalensis]|nr:chromate transporter [Variibacter gotjawalensis]